MSRPDLPRMSVATQPSLIPVSSRILCSLEALALAVVDLRLAIPGQVAQRADRLRRHEARLQQPGLQQLAKPLRVLDIGLATRALLHVPGVDEHQLEAVLEDRPDRPPVHAGGLHRDLRDAERLQPVAQRQQAVNRRFELRDVLLELAALPDAHARHHGRLVHIKRARALNDPLHHQPPSVGQRRSPPAGAPLI